MKTPLTMESLFGLLERINIWRGVNTPQDIVATKEDIEVSLTKFDLGQASV